MNYIDLHIHTNNSDGSLTPKEIIDLASKNKINLLSITDHDTLSSYTSDLFKYAKICNIRLITGIEISTKINKCGIHVLGYNIDLDNKEFNDMLSNIRNARHIYLHDVGKKLNELGYYIDIESLDKIPAVTKAHIAKDVIKNNKDLLLKKYNHIPSYGEFIETTMNEGCKAYVKKYTISPIEASNYIKKAHGLVVLAHPIAYSFEDELTDDEIEKLIIDMNADGIEANYDYVDKDNNKYNDQVKWLDIANKHNLGITIGSDYHTSDNIHPTIGLINEDINLDLLDNIDYFITKKR